MSSPASSRFPFAASRHALRRAEAGAQNDPSPLVFWMPNLPSVSRENIDWDSPASFEMRADGSWVLSVATLRNGFDDYVPGERHFRIRWTYMVDYLDANDISKYNTGYVAGILGYLESATDVVVRGRDAGFATLRDGIVKAEGYVQLEAID